MQQLVIQLPLRASTPDTEEFDEIVALEETLERISAGRVEVDGHDAGAREMNVFIISADAVATFDSIRDHLPANRPWRAGFRDLDSEKYSPLAPAGLAAFDVR